MEHKILIVWLMPLIMCSCLKERQALYIDNNSNDTLYIAWDYRDTLSKWTINPLEITHIMMDNYMGSGKTKAVETTKGEMIAPDSSITILGGGRIEYGFRGASAEFELEQNGGYITVFFFTKNFLKRNKWTDIIAKQIYSKRIRLSTHEVKNMNWHISYDSLAIKLNI